MLTGLPLSACVYVLYRFQALSMSSSKIFKCAYRYWKHSITLPKPSAKRSITCDHFLPVTIAPDTKR